MKRKLSLLYLVIVMILVASCSKKEKVESKKEVIAAQVGAAKSLDPQGTNDKRSLEVMVQVYDTLVDGVKRWFSSKLGVYHSYKN